MPIHVCCGGQIFKIGHLSHGCSSWKKFMVEESKQLGADHWVTSVRFLDARVYDKEFNLVCEL